MKRVWLGVLFLLSFSLYASCAAPTVLFHDSGELQTVASVGGIAHPSGYPTYVLLGQAFHRLVPGDAARRITLMSTFFAALALVVLARILLDLGLSRAWAVAGCILYGATFGFWWNAVRAEVYALSSFSFLLALWLGLRALERPSPGRLAWLGLAMGIALTSHLAVAPAVAVLAVIVLARTVRSGEQPGTAVFAWAFGGLLGLAPYAYLVWADLAGLPVNYLAYTVELADNPFGLTVASFDEPIERLSWLVSGAEYRAAPYFEDPLRWARNGLAAGVTLFLYELGPIALLAFVAGAVSLLRDRRSPAVLLLGIFFASWGFAAAFAEPRMHAAFLFPALACGAIVSVRGLWAARRRWSARTRSGRTAARTALAAILVVTVLAPHALRWVSTRVWLGPLAWSYEEEEIPRSVAVSWPSLRGYREARTYAERVLEETPEGALVIGRWNEITTLYYMRYVEHRRLDLALDPYYPGHEIRYAHWQNEHDVAQRPFVFLDRFPSLWQGGPPDSSRVGEERWIYVLRRPLPIGE